MVKKLLILVIIFAFSGTVLVGCSLFDSPEKAVNSYMNAFIDMNTEKADMLLAGEGNTLYFPEDQITKDMIKVILSHTSVDTGEKTKSTSTSANVSVAILGPDVQSLYEISMDEALGRYFTENNIDDAKLNKAIMEKMESQLDDENLKLIKQNVVVEVVKVDGKWLLTEKSKTKLNDICIGNIGTVKLVED